MKNELNKDGIFLLDVFHLNYYGVNIFLQVCGTKHDGVYVYELATKTKIINGEKVDLLSKNLVAAKNPLIVPKSINTYAKSTYFVHPIMFEGKLALPISVELYSPLYNKTVELGKDYPVFGTAYAFLEKECVGKYWQRRNKIKKEYDFETIDCYIN